MTDTKKMELELERKRLLVAISKAESAKIELDMKKTECLLNIQRTEDHIKLQDDRITKTKKELAELEKQLKAN